MRFFSPWSTRTDRRYTSSFTHRTITNTYLTVIYKCRATASLDLAKLQGSSYVASCTTFSDTLYLSHAGTVCAPNEHINVHNIAAQKRSREIKAFISEDNIAESVCMRVGHIER